MQSLLLCASEHPKGTKYLVQLGTPNEVSSQKRLYTLVVYVLPKKTQSQWKLGKMKWSIKLSITNG